jgi:hypothetical protein
LPEGRPREAALRSQRAAEKSPSLRGTSFWPVGRKRTCESGKTTSRRPSVLLLRAVLQGLSRGSPSHAVQLRAQQRGERASGRSWHTREGHKNEGPASAAMSNTADGGGQILWHAKGMKPWLAGREVVRSFGENARAQTTQRRRRTCVPRMRSGWTTRKISRGCSQRDSV